MNEGIYKFKPEDARRFFFERNIETVRGRSSEITAKYCPYCHGGAHKDKGTFSISLKTGMFVCLRSSCGAKGNMLTLHKDFNFDLGVDVRGMEDGASYPWRRFPKRDEIQATENALQYLTGRGISPEIVQRYEITTRKDDNSILVFPFRNPDGDLVFVKYRKSNFNPQKDKNKEWCERNCKPILFGMRQCEQGGRLIITEGQIDSLSLASAGLRNAVSVPTGKNGFTWVPHCWEWLHTFTECVVFGDLENGSMSLLSEIKKRFSDFLIVKSVQFEDYHGCKDANEILQKCGPDALRDAVNNARPEVPESIKRIADIPYTDGTEEEKLKTGIYEIDRALRGGLHFGYLDILTGRRGEGKSTEGSMIARNALQAGYSVFIYSGEMSVQDVRQTLEMQLAGDERIDERTIDDDRYYFVSRKNSEVLSNWYRDKGYIYDSSTLHEENENLIDLIRISIIQLNCRVIIVDNLMTAIDLIPVNAEKYEKQEIICKELARIAQQFNVLILLIAHKKKENGKFASDDENDDVLGSSEITNLAGVVLSYGRGRKTEELAESQRKIKLLKNRHTGKCLYDGVVLDYSEKSKQIYAVGSLPPGTCGAFEFNEINDMDEIPF